MKNMPFQARALFILYGVCLVLSGCEIFGPTNDFKQGSVLFPTVVVNQFEVCCRVQFEDSCPAAVWPSFINLGREGQYVLTEGRTLWSYDTQGRLLVEKSLFGDDYCWPIKTENGYAFVCDGESSATYTEVDDRGEVVLVFTLPFSSEYEQIIPVAGEGPIYFSRDVENRKSFVAKLDRQGGLEWELDFPGILLNRILLLEDGQLFMGGSIRDSTNHLGDGVFNTTAIQMSFDPLGMLLWEKQFTDCRFCGIGPVFDLGDNLVLWRGGRSEPFEYGSNTGFHGVTWLMTTTQEGEIRIDTPEMADLPLQGILIAEGNEKGLNLALRTESPLRTVKVGPEGRVVDTHNWPLFQESSCRLRDIIENRAGELVALMTCGGIQSCKRTSGVDWAMVKVLR